MVKATLLGLIVILFVSGGSCSKKSEDDIEVSERDRVLLETRFSSPEEAGAKVSGMMNLVVTARMVSPGAMDTAGTSTRAPALLGRLSNSFSEDAIRAMLFKSIRKNRVGLKQSQHEGSPSYLCEDLVSCEDLHPTCKSGKAEVKDCKSYEGSVSAVLIFKECKMEEGEEQILLDGEAGLYMNCVSDPSRFELELESSVEFKDFKVKYFENNKEIYSFGFSPSLKFDSKISFNVISPEQGRIEIETTSIVNGNSKEFDHEKNITQDTSFRNLTFRAKIVPQMPDMSDTSPSSSNAEFPDSITFTIEFYVDGKYSIDTVPDWCGDGAFAVKTVEPLKVIMTVQFSEEKSEAGDEGEEFCPASGSLTVNGASFKFIGENKVRITIDGSSREYTCQELYNMCVYEQRGALSIFYELLNF